MAIATFLGVFPVALLLSLTLAPSIHTWPFVLRTATFNVCVVALLTWVVMPFITRLFHRWLHSKEKQ
jgi:antibiotic biosynthesis monooxygenase (ABM) superfamily enzyme